MQFYQIYSSSGETASNAHVPHAALSSVCGCWVIDGVHLQQLSTWMLFSVLSDPKKAKSVEAYGAVEVQGRSNCCISCGGVIQSHGRTSLQMTPLQSWMKHLSYAKRISALSASFFHAHACMAGERA